MRKIVLILFLMCSIFSLNTSAQTVTINQNPTGTSGNIVFGTLNYHASEYIYKDSEIGATNFTTTPISQIGFNTSTVGAGTTFNNVNIYMKNAPGTVFTTGTYSLTGYQLVFTGSVTITSTGFTRFNLTTPFLRTAGQNLHMLIVRSDNATHTGFVWRPSLDDPSGTAATNVSRRYNSSTVAPAENAASLDASTFRAAIEFFAPSAVDAELTSITNPTNSCNTTGNVVVALKNNGTTPIAIGTANVTLRVRGANTYTNTQSNTGIIAAGGSENITFSNINISTAGTNFDTAFVSLTGDPSTSNDTLKSSFLTTPSINIGNAAPAVENVETTLPVVSNVAILAGTRQLWGVRTAQYTNTDLTGPIDAHGGTGFFLFDSYSGANSAGSQVRLFSNCINLPATAGASANVTFWMTHDNSFNTDLDSMYVSVSTNKGVTWTRLQGFGRVNPAFATPGWAQKTIDLSAYNGQTIQVGFEGVSKYGNVIGLDDISFNSTGVLPVSLLSFSGIRKDNFNLLEWRTANESNNKGFELQRSADGRNFTTIVTINSKGENGQSNSMLSYDYNDMRPLSGTNFYRLKQVDFDGKFNYSDIVTLKSKATDIRISSVYPNPSRNELNLIIASPASEKATIIVTDLSGKVLLQRVTQLVVGDTQESLNVQSLSAGTYIVKVVCTNGCDATQRFVKY